MRRGDLQTGYTLPQRTPGDGCPYEVYRNPPVGTPLPGCPAVHTPSVTAFRRIRRMLRPQCRGGYQPLLRVRRGEGKFVTACCRALNKRPYIHVGKLCENAGETSPPALLDYISIIFSPDWTGVSLFAYIIPSYTPYPAACRWPGPARWLPRLPSLFRQPPGRGDRRLS